MFASIYFVSNRLHSGLGPRWTNGDDLHLNEYIRSLVEDLEVKQRVEDTTLKKPECEDTS